MQLETWQKILKTSVIRAGDGRAFAVDLCGKHNPVVIAGAHCLPHLPESHGWDDDSRLYRDFLGPIGAKPTVWAECLFVNPVADIAVLGPPDEQRLPEEAQAYEALLQSLTPFSITDASEQSQVWLLSLECEWFNCRANYIPWGNGPLWLSTDPENIKGGMSGSPIVSDSGAAVGVVCIGSNQGESGPNPGLVRDLPRLAILYPAKACR